MPSTSFGGLSWPEFPYLLHAQILFPPLLDDVRSVKLQMEQARNEEILGSKGALKQVFLRKHPLLMAYRRHRSDDLVLPFPKRTNYAQRDVRAPFPPCKAGRCSLLHTRSSSRLVSTIRIFSPL